MTGRGGPEQPEPEQAGPERASPEQASPEQAGAEQAGAEQRTCLPDLILYSRAGCHLCEQAQSHLEALAFAFQLVDVDSDPSLKARYGDDVPVLTSGGRMLGKGVFSHSRLFEIRLLLLREARTRPDSGG